MGRERTRHLMQIMDWRSRAVLSWELSNIIDSGFCVRALRNAMALTGRRSKICNTDQGSQFSGRSFARR
ncbi:MAG: DDE-type integrase/transposase/recombinase [Verrucomicrobiales bacterium]